MQPDASARAVPGTTAAVGEDFLHTVVGLDAVLLDPAVAGSLAVSWTGRSFPMA